MKFQDDRTEEQRKTHTWLVIGTDRFLSGWGEAEGGTSIAAWACRPEDRESVFKWVSARSDMKRIREHSEADGKRYKPYSCAHCHIYMVEPGHNALKPLNP